ncbi:sigma factor [Kribbella sp. NPDC020789]
MSTFETEIEQSRHELRVHCYRLPGSYDEAEDMVQETFLRARRGRDTFQGRSSLQPYLACA